MDSVFSQFQISIYVFSIGTLLFMTIPFFLIYLKQRPSYLMVIALTLWILYYSRILLVVLVDISSFPAINYLYLLPAFPIWSAASFISITAFFNLFNKTKNTKINVNGGNLKHSSNSNIQ